MRGLSRDRKKREPDESQTTNIVPSRFDLILNILFLWTLNAFINLNYFWSSNKNRTIPSEKPTTTTLP